MRKRLGPESKGVDTYYRFKPADPPHDKVKLWEKGTSLKGRFLGQSVRGDYTDYLFEDSEGKTFSVNKTAAISNALEGIEKGTLIELEYEGKKKLPGGKSFHAINVYAHDAE